MSGDFKELDRTDGLLVIRRKKNVSDHSSQAKPRKLEG